jgi:hypothetical protein
MEGEMIKIYSFLAYLLLSNHRRYREMEQLIPDKSVKIYHPNWLLSLLLGKRFLAITFGNVIIAKFIHAHLISRIARHEYTHVEQYRRYGVFGFLYLYLSYFIKGLISYKNWLKAYYYNPLEVEARLHETL